MTTGRHKQKGRVLTSKENDEKKSLTGGQHMCAFQSMVMVRRRGTRGRAGVFAWDQWLLLQKREKQIHM